MDKALLINVFQKIGKKVIVNKSKPYIITQCLFNWNHKRGDKNPSFYITYSDYAESLCYCYSCFKSKRKLSSVFEEFNKKNDNQYSDLLEIIKGKDKFNLSSYFSYVENIKPNIKKKKEEKTDIVYDEDVLSKFKKIYIPYAYDRGITEESFNFFDMGIDLKSKRLVLPVRREDGKIVGAIGRALIQHEVELFENYPKYYFYWNFNKSHFLYGEFLYKPDTEKIFLVEGPFDAIKLYQIFKNQNYLFLATMGTDLGELQKKKIIEKNKPVYLLFDGDSKGQEFTKTCAEIFSKVLPTYICTMPNGLDPGDSDSSDDLLKNVIDSAKIFF